MIKHHVIVLLAISSAIACLGGCKGAEQTTTAPDGERVTTTTESAARSMDITIRNQTSYAMIRTSVIANHGVYAGEPPARIEANSQATFRMESNGFMTGCEGRCTYAADGGQGGLSFWYNNPYAGSNGYSESCTIPGVGMERQGGEGHDAVITWFIRKQ